MCPVCAESVLADNAGKNHHMDQFLNLVAIKETKCLIVANGHPSSVIRTQYTCEVICNETNLLYLAMKIT